MIRLRPFVRVSRRAAAIAALAASHVQAQSVAKNWSVTEVWRVNVADAGAPFGEIRDIEVTADGTVWALRHSVQVIRRFNKNGTPLVNVGRLGSRRGELKSANGMVVAADGSIWVNDPGNTRITVFDAKGTAVREFPLKSLGYEGHWDAWLDRTSGQVVDHFFNMAANNTMGWRRISPSGVVGDTLTPTTRTVQFTPVAFYFQASRVGGSMHQSHPFLSGGGIVPDGWGAVWQADADAPHAVLVRLGRSDTIARSALELPRVPVSPVEREEVIARIRRSLAAYTSHNFKPARIPATKPPIERLVVDAQSRLWIQHTARFGDTTITFDVHDRAGKHLGRVQLPRRVKTYVAHIRAMGDDVWASEQGADGSCVIVKYRVRRP